MEQTNIILEQYKTSVEAYEDKFPGIDNFAQKYGLTDFKLGLNRLKQGVVQVSNTAGTVNKNNVFMIINFILFFSLFRMKILLLKHNK